MFIDAVDLERHAVTKDEFRDLILHMAAADLHSRRAAHAEQQVRAGGGGEDARARRPRAPWPADPPAAHAAACPPQGAQQEGGEWVMSSWEQDEEIVTKLKG